MKRAVVLNLLMGSLYIVGCSQEEAPAPAGPTQQKAEVAPVTAAPTVQAPPPAQLPPGQVPAEPTSPSPAGSANAPVDILAGVDANDRPNLISLNAAYQSFFDVEMRWATDLNELVTSKRISELPPAPAGKRYAIDTASHQVILVRQ